MKHEPVQDLFSRAADSFRNETAIDCTAPQISYGTLEDRSNNLANYLVSHGAATGSMVAILTENRVEIITAIIGILKAGCVFVPLDPLMPDKRLSALVAEVRPQWFVIEAKFDERVRRVVLDAGAQAQVIVADLEEISEAGREPLIYMQDYAGYFNPEKVSVSSDPNRMCYVYFTSGSTGRPKAIAGRLKSIAHFINWEIKTFGIEQGTRVSQLTTPAFDAFLRDIFAPLCAGGTVCIPPDRDTLLDARNLIRWIEDRKINLIHCVPSLFRSILNEELHPENFPDLKYILMAGEPLLPTDVRRWMDAHGERIQLVNLYGPTETTMTKFYYLVQPSDKNRRAIPIGKPIDGARALVMDTHGRASSQGAVGEIYIRTPFRTLGYLNQPELTRELFVPNPFNDDPNDLIYKTGDLGRLLPDGNFEFLGRRDHQVKIRGVRIELGEIHDLLRSHPSVKDVAVVDQEDAGGNKHLCAYVVLKEETETAKLKEYLSQALPEYMIPSVFMKLEELPRTLSGKVDRKSLPTLDQTQAKLSGPRVKPRTPIEEVLAGICKELLNIEEIGIYDSFFDLGGHSLLATQLLSRARAAFEVELQLRSLFEAPTIEGMARNIETARQNGSELKLPPLTAVSRDGALPLSFAQQRLWFLHQLEPDSDAYNIFGAVRLTQRLDLAALEHSLSEIVRRHEVLRTTFVNVEGEPVQAISEPSALKLETVELLDLPETEREAILMQLIEAEARKPFDLSTGPLFRVSLLRFDDDDHVLLYTMHHIISDGWSMGVLTKELAAHYAAYTAGQPSSLPELPIQYADYAVWQREWLQEEALEDELNYWRQQLAGAPALLDLPTDRPRPPVRTYRGAIEYFMLPADLSHSLQLLSRRESVTLFMTLLAAFQTLLHKSSGQTDFIIGTDIANRTRAETEALIGFFINQLPLRCDLSGNPSFLELLKRVREVTLGAFAHQSLPFDKVVEEMQPERSLSHTPLFQVLFVLQNAPVSSLHLADVNIIPLEYDNPTSKFDLILQFVETTEGLRGSWRYSTDLFEAATITRLTQHLETLLRNIIAQPESRLSKLHFLSEHEQLMQKQREQERREERLKRFKSLRPKPVSLPQINLVKTENLGPDIKLPLVITPAQPDLDLISWAASERSHLESLLLRHGALLFRHFHLSSAPLFEHFASTLCPDLYANYGDLPRQSHGGKVYGSTPYPPQHPILFHNESSHLHCWPLKIFFCCLIAPTIGGETPIVDCRRVYERMPARLRAQFAERGLMYVRNYTEGLDVSWEEFFRTSERAEVEVHCRQVGMEWEWLEGNGLRTRKVCRGVAEHPQTGEVVMFNQVQAHHVSFLVPEVRESLERMFGREGMPRNVYWGDGEEIEDEEMAEVRRVYEEEAVSFGWEVGDVLMLDNMLVAHGRNAYEGAREIVVAMGEMMSELELEARSSESVGMQVSRNER